MQIYQAIILGIVQGLTEFLPISSSGHLILFEKLLNINIESNMFFDIALHFGTFFAVVVVFFKDILNLFKPPFKNILYLIIATIPAGVLGVLFSDVIDEVFFDGSYLTVGFLVTALLLIFAESYYKTYEKNRTSLYKDINSKNALVIGLFQAFALLPAISRSGATITAGCFCKVKKEQIAKFSFLMSLPVILGSLIVVGVKTIKAKSEIYINLAVIGAIISFIFGFLAIKIMLKIISKANYKYFSIYLVIVAIISALI